jgi:hypothetical protein
VEALAALGRPGIAVNACGAGTAAAKNDALGASRRRCLVGPNQHRLYTCVAVTVPAHPPPRGLGRRPDRDPLRGGIVIHFFEVQQA